MKLIKISFKKKIGVVSLFLEYEKDGKKEKFSVFNSPRLGKIS